MADIVDFDHAASKMRGAIARFTPKTVAALVIITDEGDGADHEILFYGVPHGEGYKQLGILQTGIAVVQDDMFDSES